jgi:hypothetical protein
MKKNAVWILITLFVLSFLLLLPTSHASRSESSNASPTWVADAPLSGRGFDSTFKLTPHNLLQTQDSTSQLTPASGQAVGFAVSEPLRDLPDAKDKMRSDTSREGEEEGSAHEYNELNARETKMARASADKAASIDRALQGAKPIESETPTTPSLTFDGISAADNIATLGGTGAPSDQNLDVGPNDVVQTVNTLFRIWDKNGNPKIPLKTISSLFSNLGGICASTDRGDPVVLYDRMADRWFITQFAFLGSGQAPPFHQCVAVSKTGDPAGVYFTYDFNTPTMLNGGASADNFPDYGKFGVWPDGYYMTVNQFSEPGDHSNGVGAYALDRKKMLAGDPTAIFIYFDLNGTVHPEFFNSTLPSDQDGLEAPPAGAPNVFAYLISDEFEAPPFNKDALRLFDFHADFNNPANSTFTERAESPVLVSAFDPRNPPGRSEVKQPAPAAGTDSLDSIPYHLMYRLQYRNRGGIETLVSSATVNVSGVNPTNRTLYQAGVRYFELQKSSPGGAYLLYDNATFSPDAGNPATGVNRWLPSAAIDHMGNLAVSYSTSSTSVFPSIWYAGRDFNAFGGLAGEQHLFDGTAVQLGSSNRWGDYQSLQVDPSDDCTFWTTNQYYNVNSSFNWRTRIGRFKFPTCQAPAQGTISGTITACDSGVPISGAMVQLSNGFSGTTKADGTYSITVEPGTYAVTVLNGLRNCTPSASTALSVTNGGTTTFNTCVSGIANPIYDATLPNAAVVSGGNGNAIIDADECNDLTVKLENLGCAPARNITAHLSTSTPGVTITQSNSPYADIPIDANGTNLVPFSISTSSSFVCGTTINFTITATFTGGSSTSTFSLQTCTETLPPVTVNGSIDPTDAKSTAGRIGRNGVRSDCGVPKACPGALGSGGRSFDQYSFTNQGSQTACASITLSSAGGINLIGSTYSGSYDPTDTTFCVNYLGDPGGSNNGDVNWRVDVAPGATFVVVVMEVNAGTAATPYSLTVSGLRATPVDGGGVCQTCAITAPANINVNNDANQCGAVVTFPAPTVSGTCGIVSVSPASGSFFPVGTTTVNITSTAGTAASFTVKVNDTQPPAITCPANITATTAPNATSRTVTYAATASDNCPGTNITYNPPSGSSFNLGTTPVTATATDAVGNTASCSFNVTVNQPQTFQINSPTFSTSETGGAVSLNVTRTGGSAGTATVDYATQDGSATQKGDYIIERGTLKFADGETSKNIQIPVIDDVYVEGDETFTLNLSNPAGGGASLGGNSSTTITIVDNDLTTPTGNPIDDAQFFVRQQYLDFLNRQPDAGGLAFWTSQITACGSNAACINQKRVDVSAAFFLSNEFQNRGFFIYRIFNTLAGNRPTYLEYMADLNRLPGVNLDQEKQAYVEDFLLRPIVLSTFPLSQNRDQFIDALLARLQSAGINLSSKRSELVAEYDAGTNQLNSRARAVIKLIGYTEYSQTQFNAAFVLSQYFDYLRREPDAGGYQFWLNVLNHNGSNFRGMVCAFLTSQEYQERFSPVRTRTDSVCSSITP